MHSKPVLQRHLVVLLELFSEAVLEYLSHPTVFAWPDQDYLRVPVSWPTMYKTLPTIINKHCSNVIMLVPKNQQRTNKAFYTCVINEFKSFDR